MKQSESPFLPQVEFSNVVVVNKCDLITEEQKADVIAKISLLNPKAKIVESIQSRVKMADILDTWMYKAEENKNEFWKAATTAETSESNVLECCEKLLALEGEKCCERDVADDKIVDSGVSQVGLCYHIVVKR